MSELFGKAGRAWLTDVDLAGAEGEAVDAGLRQIDLLSVEIDPLDRAIAVDASNSPDVHR